MNILNFFVWTNWKDVKDPKDEIVQQTEKKSSLKVTKKWGRIISKKGKKYKTHPLSTYYTQFPDLEHIKGEVPVKPLKNLKNSDTKKFEFPAKQNKGGLSFTIDLDNTFVKSSVKIPRRFLCMPLWNCISRPQVIR